MTEGLLFRIPEMLGELDFAERLARPFLENGSSVFRALRTQLEGIRDEHSGRMIPWEIPSGRPLRTIVSRGEYERGSKGRRVVGTLSFKWEVVRVHPKKPKLPAQELKLVGVASTMVRVLEVETDDNGEPELAMWRTEVGDAASPGCHFHVQILGESLDPPFPKSLSVPRLPTCLTTPMATMEFMLGELFQERWRKHISAETQALQSWRNIQRERMRRLFSWHSESILASGQTPWAMLKAAKPRPDIFVK